MHSPSAILSYWTWSLITQMSWWVAGFVLKKVIGSNNENGKIKVKSLEKDGFDVWKADAMFGEFSYWKHDTLPTKDDSIRSVMEWLPVSAAVSFLLKINSFIFAFE